MCMIDVLQDYEWNSLSLCEEDYHLDGEAARIFLESERTKSIINAVVDLHGRYFGGWVVRACFHHLDKCSVLDLAKEV